MSLLIRPAVATDVPSMADLAEEKRRQYATWQPVFHKPAANAKSLHSEFLTDLLNRDDCLVLVAENSGSVLGFIFAQVRPAPPVYEPGGKVLSVDDFVLQDQASWSSLGRDLLKAAWERGKARGAVLAIVVCGPKDLAKRQAVQAAGLDVASEWWVGEPKS